MTEAAAAPALGARMRLAERRLVTVLFVDLTGYTHLCEERDAEEVHALVRPLMEELRDLCTDSGAYVPLIAGDGFMAAFGVPVAREDDPFRAVAAAVAAHRLIQSRRAEAPDVPGLHTGLHLGEAVVEQRGAGEWALSGDVVNVASRLCSVAGPDELLATTEVAALAGVDEGWEQPRTLTVRGRSSGVEVRSFAWRDHVPRSRRTPSTDDAYTPRPELEGAVLEAIADGGPGVLLLGEAGHGKSRLVSAALSGRSHLTVSCAPLLHPQVRDVLAELVTALPSAPEGLAALLSGELSAQGEEPGGDELLAAGGRALAALPAGSAVVLDDAERLPAAEWVRLGRVIARSDVPWVVVSREDLGGLDLPEVRVPPLTDEQARACVSAHLPGASPELVQVVVARGGGSPLFLEQCARLLVESGAVARGAHGYELVDRTRLGAVPTSMRQFITSRLDLLPEAERTALNIAAVLGEVVEVALLRRLVGEPRAHEPLLERGLLVPYGGDGQENLRFAHSLVRDVAYEGLLKARRIEIHRAAAEWYAVLPTSQVLEARAHHLEASVRLGGADCALVREAVEAMVLFARAVEVERTVVARDLVHRARSLVEARPECAVETLVLELCQAAVSLQSGEHATAAAAAARAEARARELKDAPAGAEALLLHGRAVALSDPARAKALLDDAQAAFDALGDLSGVAKVVLERGVITHREEGLVSHVEDLGRAHQLAMRSGDSRLRATVAQRLAVIGAIALGRHEHETWSEQARAVSRADDVSLEPQLELAAALLGQQGLDPASGLEPSASALRAGRELGLAFVYRNAALGRLYLLLFSGRLEEAWELLAEARQFAATESTAWMSLQLDLLEARLSVRAGNVGAAVALLDGVAESALVAQQGLARDLAEMRAAVSLERGLFRDAVRFSSEALAIDERMGERCAPLRPRLTRVIAMLAGGSSPTLAEMAVLREQSRATGLTAIHQLAQRWVLVQDLTQGFEVDQHGLEPQDIPDAVALDHEIAAFTSRDWDQLLHAAGAWRELGTTVWQARALLWHSELSGVEHPEADELLASLGAPAELAETLRAQVRSLT